VLQADRRQSPSYGLGSRHGALIVTGLLAMVLVGAIAGLAGRGTNSASPRNVAAVARRGTARSHPTGGAAGHTAQVSPASAGGRYGGLPSWLPKTKITVDRTVLASAAHPKLAIEGDSVIVALNRGRTRATAVGPTVPEEGQFPVPASSPCTFVITFASASGAVPLRRAAFTILDEQGRLHHPRVTLRGGGPVPARVKPHQTVSLIITDVLPTGNGQLRWSPANATRPIASWDFDVEID
jgi:hypothetical protein